MGGKDTNNKVIKRIIDEDDENEIDQVPAKQQKIERPTDLLSNNSHEREQKNSWDKSIGTINNKNRLKGLIVKRKIDKQSEPQLSQNTVIATNNTSASSIVVPSETLSSSNVSTASNTSGSDSKSKPLASTSNVLGSLGLDYSDTDSD